jgi:hypothetical protein
VHPHAGGHGTDWELLMPPPPPSNNGGSARPMSVPDVA